MSCSPHGLNMVHWVWCVAMGSIGLLVALIIKVATPNLMIDVHVAAGK